MTPWLSLIGVGEDGFLAPAARALLDQAETVFGGARHFDRVGPIKGEKILWPSPITEAIGLLQARRGAPVAVLATGDPFFYGVGALIASHFPHNEWLCLPQPSAFSLAAARLGWSLQDCGLLSLHGRTFERLIPSLRRGARLLALSWDGATPAKIAAELAQRKMGRSRIIVLEALGGPRERIRETLAQDYDLMDVDPLNLAAIEVIAEPDARIAPLTPGLPDDFFLHDEQITKRDIRALTLSALAPQGGELLWDIGAGSGSIAIEWMLADRTNRAVALEPRADRARNIARNAALLGTPDLRIQEACAPEGLNGLPQPDAIFIGGGATTPGVMEAAFAALPPQGRLVLNAVTLETQTLAARLYAEKGGELTAIQLAEAAPLGGFAALRPALPIWRWRWIKP